MPTFQLRRCRSIVLLCIVAILVLLATFATTLSAQPRETGLSQARTQLATAQSYRITSTIDQQLIPLAHPELIGQTDQRIQLQIDGTINQSGSAHYMFRNTASHESLAFIQQQGQFFIEHAGTRTPIANPSGALAPSLNPLDYLAAADQVTSEVVAAETTHYRFTLRGTQLARHIQSTSSSTVAPGVAAVLQSMTGTGEVLVGADGMPTQQLLTLYVPGIEQRYNAEIRIETHFSEIVAPALAPGTFTLPTWLQNLPQAISMPQIASIVLFLAVMLLMALLVHHNWRVAHSLLSFATVAVLVLSPVLLPGRASAAQAQVVPELAASLLQPAAEPSMPQPAQVVTQTPPPPPAATSCGAGNAGVDTDSDELTDQQEFCLGTDAYRPDTDGDGLHDGLEVIGLSYASRNWPTNPLSPDSNRDGRIDTVEWPAPDGAARSADLDNDGVPNLWDGDDDGDNVPDSLDISPEARTAQVPTFTINTSGDGYNGYQYVEIQVRPSTPARLNYSNGSLNWPRDTEGQIQDHDESAEDVRLIPMLEIITNRAPNAELAQRYNLGVLTRNGQTILYAPLSPVSEYGAVSAFTTRFAFAPGELASLQLQTRMVWFVQGALDREQYGRTTYNQQVIIQTYPEPSFQVTGLQITLSRDVESAILGMPNATDDRQFFQLLYGWQAAVLNAQQIEGQSPLRTTMEEAAFRLSAPNTPIAERWGLNTPVVTDIQAYGHIDQSLGDLNSNRVIQFLTTHGYQNNARLALAYQEESGSYSLDETSQLEPASTVNVGLATIQRHIVRGIRMSSYSNQNGWRQLTDEEALQATSALNVEADLLALGARYPSLSQNDLQVLLSTLYFTWNQGSTRVIASDGPAEVVFSQPANELATRLTNSETTSAAYLMELLKLGDAGEGLRIGGALADDHVYMRANEGDQALGLAIPEDGRNAFVFKKDSTEIYGTNIPRLSVKGLLGVYKAYTSIQILRAANTFGGVRQAAYVDWFKANKTWSNTSKVGKALKVAGTAFTIGMAWAEFGLTTDFSNPKAVSAAVSKAIVATVIAIAMFALSLNPAGAVLAAMLAIIDLIFFFATGEGLTDRIVKAVAEFFYDYNILTVLESADFRDLDSRLWEIERGLTVGNKFIVSGTFIGAISRTDDGSVGNLQHSSVSGWYEPVTRPGTTPAAVNGTPNCGFNADSTIKTCTSQVGVEYLLTAATLNASLEFTGRIRAVTFTEECIFGICDTDTQTDSYPENPEPTILYLDILPATVDALWNWNALQNPDSDGDGLSVVQETRLGTSATTWDSDSDGLGDAFEAENGLNATNADTDGDGLNDYAEQRALTNPLQADSDGDGLSDGLEVLRWENNQQYGGWQITLPGSVTAQIFANPNLRDRDTDLLNDLAESLSGTSPFAANRGPDLRVVMTPYQSNAIGRAGVFGTSGDAVQINLSLVNGGTRAIASELELCLPAVLTNVTGGLLYGARRPAMQTGTCGSDQRYYWAFDAANALQVGESITTTLHAQFDPAQATSISTSIHTSLPYSVDAEFGSLSYRATQHNIPATVDLDDPLVTLAGVQDGAIIRGSNLVLGGTASDPSSWVTQVEISTNGGTSFDPVISTPGEWTYSWNLPTDGIYTLLARARDLTGRTATTAPISVRVDNTAPNAAINLANNAFIRPAAGGETIALSGTATDNLAGLTAVQISIDNKPWRDVILATPGAPASTWNYDWRLPGGAAAQGVHTIAVRAMDRAANQTPNGAIATRTFIVDLAPPTDDLTSNDYLADAAPEVRVGEAVTLSGRANDQGNVPLPANPQPLNGTLDALGAATVWLMPDAAAEVTASTRMTWLGDVNGDGKGDLAIGLPAGETGAGKIVVVYGRGGDWPAIPNVEALATTGSTLLGEPNAGLGGMLAPAGDTNADGYNDFLVGDPANNRAYLLLGRDGGLGNLTLAGDTNSGQTLFATPGLQFVAPAGDVNRDGADDLLFGFGGQLYLVLGYSGAWPEQIDPIREAAAILTLPANGVATGLGDTNGDGFDDFALGNPATGNLSLYQGNATFTRAAKQNSAASTNYAGFAGMRQIVALGDTNGGGRSDFAYTTATKPNLVLDGGGATSLNYLGADAGFLAAPGDLNADGRNDLLLGVPGDQSALIIHGGSPVVAATLTGVAGAASAPYAAGADLNCDASSDLLLLPTAVPAAAPPASERELDSDSFITPSRLPGASITTPPPTPALPAGTRSVDDDYCATCPNDGLIWNVNAFPGIQEALDTAGSVDTILVRPGVYPAFAIPSTRGYLSITGVHPDSVIVEATSSTAAVQINSSSALRLSNMTLRKALYGVQLVNAGAGGSTYPNLRIKLDRLVIHSFANAIRMTRDSTLDITRSTIAGSQTSGSYISIDTAIDTGVLPAWAAANTVAAMPQANGAGGRLLAENSQLYALRGNGSATLDRYNSGSPGSWTNMADMPSAVDANAVATAGVDGNLYAAPSFNPTDGNVRAIAVDGNNIYIGGHFSSIDNNGIALATNNVAWWDGSTWSNMAGGLNSPGEYVSAIALMGGNLYASTTPITPLSGGPCCGVFRWDGTSWTRILDSVAVSTSDGAPFVSILTMLADGGKLYVAGNFNYYTSPGSSTLAMGGSGVLVWNGSSWNNEINSNSVFRPITAIARDPATDRIYVGTSRGAIWRSSPGGSFDSNYLLQARSMSSDEYISSLRWDGSDLIIAGNFDRFDSYIGTYNNIARYNYNPATFTTTISPFGSGTNGPIHALVKSGSSIYATGNFTSAGGNTTNDLAEWNGSAWQTFTGDVTDTTSTTLRPLAVTSSGDVLIGGDFQGVTNGTTTTSRIYDIARYSAGNWGPLNAASRGVTTVPPPAMQRFLTGSSTWESRAAVWADWLPGSAMVADGAYAYVLKGGDGEFMRYSLVSDTWQRRASLPIAAAPGTALAWAGISAYAIVGGTNRLFRYNVASDSWTELASVPTGWSPTYGNFSTGASLQWDGNHYLYATNGGGGNRFARYAIVAGNWQDFGTVPGLIGAGGSLVRVGTTIYASRGASTAVDRFSPVGIYANKLTIAQTAFVAPATLPNPDWIDLDAATEDFQYTTTNLQWTTVSGQTWQAPGQYAPVALADARFFDQANEIYRLNTGSALTTGYTSPRPDAYVSPLYCATCANDGYQWGTTAFSSIQAAIDSGAPRVLLSPGVFREAISLVSGVQVIGSGADLSIIEPPSTAPIRAIVSMEGIRGATLARVTIAGSGTGTGKPVGIVVEQAAEQIRIARNIIRNASTGIVVNGDTTSVEIINNTLIGNAAGLHVTSAVNAGRVNLRNTILANHSGTALTFNNGTVVHSYNGYYQNVTDISTGVPGLGDRATDPFFLNPAISDYRLRDGSPMINAGSPNDPTPPGTSGRVDIGYMQRGQAAYYADDNYGPNGFNDGLDWQVDAFASIQDALNAAERALRTVGCRADANGTCTYQLTVGVGPGIYNEQVRMPSQVRLLGSGAEQTMINGAGGAAITFDSVVNAAVSGFTLVGATGIASAVHATGSANTISISRSILRSNSTAIRFDAGSSGEVSFNTIVNNTTAINADGASSWVRAEHNILANNTTAGMLGSNAGAVYSDFNLRYASPDGAGVILGDGNIAGQDPLFINAAGNDYRLQANSPALDQAAPWATPPAGGGILADLGYAELLARPLVLLFGKEGLSCAAGNSGVQQVEVGLVRVLDQTQPVTATLPLTWASATLAQVGNTASYWSAGVTPATAGYYRIYTRATDVAGNREDDQLILYSGALIADGTAPTVSWIDATAINTSAAAIELLATTNDGNANNLFFEVDSGSFSIAGGWVEPTWVSGNRQFRTSAVLPVGSYSIVAVVRDRAGNEGRSAARSVTITAPANHTATFISPLNNSYTNQLTITVEGVARFTSVNGTGSVALRVNGGAPIQATLASPTALTSSWSATIALGATGAKTITATPSNASGAGSVASLTITLDQTAPTLSVPGTTPIVTQNVNLSGNASDAESGLRLVEVSFDGGFIWLPATVSTGTWGINWTAPASPQNVSYPVRVRATDHAGNQTLRSLTLIVDTNAPTLGDISFNIEPGSYLDTPPAATLIANWTAPSDDGGTVNLFASIDQSPTTSPMTPAGSSLSRALDQAGEWYFHMRAVDIAGNVSERHLGPWYVRDVGSCGILPINLDGLIELEANEWRLDRNLIDDDERPLTPQSLYAALDIDSLHLGWRGARWAVDGVLYIYINTGAVGSFDPITPITGAGPLPFPADLAIAINSPAEGAVWRYNGTTWQQQTLTPAQFSFTQGDAGDTEIRINRSQVGSLSGVVAFAADEAGAPWSVFPTTNPLEGTWSDFYNWSSVSSCITPLGQGQPQAISLDLHVTALQDVNLPLGPNTAVLHEIRVTNREPRTMASLQLALNSSAGMSYESLAGVSCPACTAGAPFWTFAIPDLAAGASTLVTVTARLDANLGTTQLVTSTINLRQGIAPRATQSVTQRVDGLPPTVTLTQAAGNAMLPGTQLLNGTASDGDGAGVLRVEILPEGGSWQTVDGTLEWSFNANVPIQPNWTVQVRAVDLNGLTSTPISYSFNVDQVPPIADLTLPALLVGSTAVITGTAQDPQPAGAQVASIEVQIDDSGSAWLSGSVFEPNASGEQAWAFTWNLPDADNQPYQLRVRAIDEAGNVGLPSAWRSTHVDSRVPTITMTQEITAVDLAVYPETALLRGEISDGSGIGSMQMRVFAPTGDSYLETIARTGADWSYTPQTALTAGSYRLVLEYADSVGNAATREFALSVTGQAPPPLVVSAITLTNPTVTNLATVRFNITFNMTVTGVLTSNLALTSTGITGAAIISVSGSGASYQVDVQTGTGDGTLGLTMANSVGVQNIVQKPVTNLPYAGPAYTIDKTAPTASIDAVTPNLRNTAVPTITLRFSEPVTGLDLADLELTRDGTPVSLASATITGSGDTYVLGNLAGLTVAEGVYQLTLLASGSAILDAGSNALVNSPAVTFTIDTTAPIASFTAVVPDPRNTAVPTITLSFSNPITGLDVSDLSLTRDGSTNLLTGTQTLTSADDQTWVLGNLSSLTANHGSYALVLNGAGAGITDLAGNSFTAFVSTSFAVDTIAPTVDSIVRLDATLTNAASVRFQITFSEPVATLSIDNLGLVVSGVISPTITGVTGSGRDWTVTVDTGSGDGTLGLRLLNSTNLVDAATNPVLDFSTTSLAYTLDRTALLAEIVAIDPTPRNTSVPTITIRFGKPVSGFDLGDLSLTRDGGANLIDVSTTLTTSDNQIWVVGNLAGLTSAAGVYTITLTASGSGIVDGASNPLAADASSTFRIDLTAPTVQIEAITPDPRNTGVATITIRFDEPIVGLDLSDLALTRDNGADLLGAGLTLTSLDNQEWILSNLTGLTTLTGDYQLSLVAGSAGVADIAGNALALGATESFEVDTTLPEISIAQIVPNLRATGVVSITLTASEPVTGLDLADLRLTRDGTNVSLTGATLSGSGSSYTLSGLGSLTASSGEYLLTVIVAGANIRDHVGNQPTQEANVGFTVDATAPTAQIDSVVPNPRTTSVMSMTIRFSEPVGGVDLSDLQLTHTSGVIDLTSATLEADTTGQVYTLSGLERLTWQTGQYTLTLRAAGSQIVDALNNELAGDATNGFNFSKSLVFFPLIIGAPKGPDLVATIQLSPDTRTFQPDQQVLVTVEVVNQGDQPTGGFWVDLMLNPDPIPTRPTIWQNTCTQRPCYGLTWFVSRGLAPGERIILTSQPGSYASEFSRWSGLLLPGTQNIYVVVDSWNGSAVGGAVTEYDEQNNIVKIEGIMVPLTPDPSPHPKGTGRGEERSGGVRAPTAPAL